MGREGKGVKEYPLRMKILATALTKPTPDNNFQTGTPRDTTITYS